MKHKGWIILILISIFLASQVVGLYVAKKHSERAQLPLNMEKPTVENKSTSFIPITVFIVLATIIGLLLIRFRLSRVWRIWFFFGIFFTLMISFSAFIDEKFAIIIALSFAFIRILKNNVLVHNFTEIFIYGALAAILAPILNVFSAFLLLIVISVYDYIAVRKTKHMIKLAKFQGKAKIFAGLMIPYREKSLKAEIKGKLVGKSGKGDKISLAILGGGDIGFPLLFAAVAMMQYGLAMTDFRAYIIPLFSAIALAGLFFYGSSKKFYPAMPYITAGCTIGYIVLRLLV